MTTMTRSTLARQGRAAMALSLAALAPGLGHLSLGSWVKGSILLFANIGALLTAMSLLASMVPNHAAMTADEMAMILSPEQVWILFGVTIALISCIVYSVRDVKRLLNNS